MSDFMELGDSGLVPIGKGWLLDPSTGHKTSPEGRVFNKEGEVIHVIDDDNHDDEERDRL